AAGGAREARARALHPMIGGVDMSGRALLLWALLGSTALLGGCASLQRPACTSSEQHRVSELLYFGTAKPGGVVSAQEWSAFLASEVTPRFPQGLSVWPAAGQWQSADGSLTREDSMVLNVLHADSAGAEAAIQAIVAAYKMRFEQEAVLRVKSHACVSF
ncbi:MAG: DUF3574 domain-containing protein, partial [Panacagrimonas sp.]